MGLSLSKRKIGSGSGRNSLKLGGKTWKLTFLRPIDSSTVARHIHTKHCFVVSFYLSKCTKTHINANKFRGDTAVKGRGREIVRNRGNGKRKGVEGTKVNGRG